MESNLIANLLLRGVEVPLEVFVVLVLVTGGIYLLIFVVDCIRSAARSIEYDSAKKHFLKKTEDSIYALAAAMIRADGRVDAEELAVAEAIGRKLYDKFNSKRFREIVEQEPLSQHPIKLVNDANEVLTEEGKEGVLIYLQHIALADGEVHEEEKRLLSIVARGWKLPEPEWPEDHTVEIEGIMYALAASVITADGVVEENEIVAAVAIGEEIFERFNPEELYAVCENSTQIPKPEKLAIIVKDYLTADGKELIVKFLSAIASSSDNDNQEGWNSVSSIARTWDIEMSR